ncbi:Eisosome component PIL1 [Ceratobasidium theobromae]|uniref:Eisosome component PIL1 n=1 Tax=Ceratobasidium theobromae TaxID=1582974 RepID=A0A5N5QH73_9AGAM|nr:Eisosome component PIL1 [Ceratobasidium theobromae]
MAGPSSRNRASILSRALALSAPPDAHVRALQELDRVEKQTSATAQKLAHELNGFDIALKNWAKLQNEDLEDVSSHSANLFAQLSSALVCFASYGEQLSQRFEPVRERGQRLSALRMGRAYVGGKLDAAQKRVDKLKSNLKPKHHVYTACNDRLENLKKQAEQIDADIPVEEAAHEDCKRQAAREWLGRKFAEVVELSNKMRVIGEAGRRIVQEIPLGGSPLSDPRVSYTGRERTVALYSQAIIDIHRIQIPNVAHSNPYQSQLDDQPDDDSRSYSDESTPPVQMFTRSSRPESLLPAGRQMGDIYPSVISRSTHAPDTASTSELSPQFPSTDQITLNTSSSAVTIVSIASPSSIRSTTNGNVPSRRKILRHRRPRAESRVDASIQPLDLSRHSKPSSHVLYPLPEELTIWPVGSAMATTSTRE